MRRAAPARRPLRPSSPRGSPLPQLPRTTEAGGANCGAEPAPRPARCPSGPAPPHCASVADEAGVAVG